MIILKYIGIIFLIFMVGVSVVILFFIVKELLSFKKPIDTSNSEDGDITYLL